MTETQKPYVVNQALAWTVGYEADNWTELSSSCRLFSPPSYVRSKYIIDDDGLLYANGVPDELAFRGLWEYLTAIEKALPRAMGNAMNYAELHFGDDLFGHPRCSPTASTRVRPAWAGPECSQ